jgi:fatty acid desaturase
MPSNPFTDPHWATSVVDAIDSFVAFVRDRTTKPAVVLFVSVIFLIGLMRALNSLLDIWWSRDTAVWASYFIIGAIFVVLGALSMRQRSPRD